jgi:hypothetical protein
MFYAPGIIFGGTEVIGSRFHIWRAKTLFRQYRGRRLPFLCFALPDSFPEVSRSSGPVFMFCAPVFVFGCTEGVRSRFHILRNQTRFRLYRGRRLPFSCFVLPDSFPEVSRASGPVFMFCAPVFIFGGYRGRQVPFSCFALPDSISAVPSFNVLRSSTHFRQVTRASGAVFKFSAPGLTFGS